MRKIVALSVILLLAATSCKKESNASFDQVLQSKDVKTIKNYVKDLDQQKQELESKIKKVKARIEQLEPNLNIPLVTSFSAKEQSFVHYLELQGNVETKKNLLVYPEVPGIIQGIYVKSGQYVNKGQSIARIDNGGLSNQLAQAETGLALAKTTYERQKRLWDQKIGSEIQFLQAKTNFESQSNVVKQLQKTLSRYVVKAPFSGVIDQVMKETGALVAPGRGSEICRVVNLSDMYVSVDVPESYISMVKKGKQVQVDFPVLSKTIRSKVRQAGSYINPANRTFKVEVYIPNKDKTIKPNLTAKLKINDYQNEKAIMIPQSIISENAQGDQYIYILDNRNGKKAKSKQIFIKTGKTQGDEIEVLEGVKDGMQIIAEGARSVKDGQDVEVSNFKVKQ